MNQRVKSLLSLAVHENTPDPEALSALRQLGRVISKSEGGIEALFTSTAIPARPLRSFNSTRNEIDELQTKLEQKTRMVARLEKDNEKLHTQVAQLQEENQRIRESARDRFGRVREDGTMPYDEFAFRVKRILGDGWVEEFLEQTGMENRILNRMRVNGTATAEAVGLIASLKPVVEVEPEKAFWMPEEVQIIRKLAPQCVTEIELADAATKEISKKVRDRLITPGQIHKLRVDAKNGNGVFKIAGYGGKREIALGRQSSAPKGTQKARSAAFPWTLYPKLEMELARNFVGQSGKRRSARQWAEHISKETGQRVTEGMVKQRLNNNAPPKQMMDETVTSGEITWAELWFLGSHINKRAWNQEVWQFLGMPARQVGDSLDDLNSPANQKGVELLRRFGREHMSQRGVILDVLKRSGPSGMTRRALREQVRRQFGVNASSHLKELQASGFVSVNGQNNVTAPPQDDDLLVSTTIPA